MNEIKKHIPNLLKIRKELEKIKNYYINSYDLRGACAISSYIVFLYFKKAGFEIVSIKANDGHCWVQVENYIIDLTATQFDVEHEIYIINERCVKRLNFYDNPKTYLTTHHFSYHLKGWLKPINPFFIKRKSNRMKLILKEFV